MCDTLAVSIDPPRVERCDQLLLAGLQRRHISALEMNEILEGVERQWQCFHQRRQQIPHAIGQSCYGVCLRIHDGDMGFDYFCGVEVADAKNLPDGITTLAIPPLRYAVFRHTGPASQLVSVYLTIFGKSLPEAGLVPADGASDAPDFVECFDERYDLATKTGGPIIMVPLKD